MEVTTSSPTLGGDLTRVSARMTKHGNHILAASDNSIRLHDATTAHLLRHITPPAANRAKAHTPTAQPRKAPTIVDLAPHPTRETHALSAHDDGTLLLWDIDDAVVLRAWSLGVPIAALRVDAAAPETAYVLTASAAAAAHAGTDTTAARRAPRAARPGRVYAVPLRVSKKMRRRADASSAAGVGGGSVPNDDGDDDDNDERDAELSASSHGSLDKPWPAEGKELFRASSQTLEVAVCGGEAPQVATIGGTFLTVHDTATGATASAKLSEEECKRAFTCLALSPTEGVAATADSSGRIQLWRLAEVWAAERASAQGARRWASPAREMHWHAQPVSAVAFDADGARLFSAGREGVLVFWDVHSAERDFLPRLGSAVLGLTPSPDGGRIALRGADNALQIVDIAAKAVVCVIHGLRRAARMSLDRRTGSVVLYGAEAAASLQWWDVRQNRQLLSLAAAPTNLSASLPAVGGRRDGRHRRYRDVAAAGGTAAPRVTHVSLSSSGTHLATFECRANAELRQHTCLKFWALREASWTLLTRVPQPHNASPLNDLAFHPSLLLAVSVANDAKFKLWEAVRDGQCGAGGAGAEGPRAADDASSGGWACRSVGFYRQSAATAAAFSADGSLLAVAYAPDVVTLWEPLSIGLLARFTQPLAAGDCLSYVGFPAEGGTLFVHSRRALFCRCMLSGQLLWSYEAAEVLAAAADTQSEAGIFAVSLAPVKGGSADERFALLEFGSRASGSVPLRAWRLGTRPRAVCYAPAAMSSAGVGVPLCLDASGKLFALHEGAGGAAAAGFGAPAAHTLSLKSSGRSLLESIFGTTPKSDSLVSPEDGVAARRLDASLDGEFEGGGEVGWEVRNTDAWLRKHLADVPSHLLPPVSVMYPHLLAQALRPAPHLRQVGSDKSEPITEAEEVERARADANGTGARFALEVDAAASALKAGLAGAMRRRKKFLGKKVGETVRAPGGATTADEDGGDDEDEGAAQDEGTAMDDGDDDLASAGELVGDEPVDGATAASPWPPSGFEPCDLGGLPNPGFLVRDVDECARRAAATMAAVQREGREGLDELASWMLTQGLASAEEESSTQEVGEEELALLWEPLDESPRDISDRLLDGDGPLATHSVERGGPTLQEELVAARDALYRAGLRCDGERGYGIARTCSSDDLCEPPRAGWQHCPTKEELRALASELRADGADGTPSLAVLAAALSCSNSRKARKAAKEVRA